MHATTDAGPLVVYDEAYCQFFANAIEDSLAAGSEAGRRRISSVADALTSRFESLVTSSFVRSWEVIVL